MPSSTWNPSEKNARIALSGGNLVATSDTSHDYQGVVATDYKSAGKFYFEVLLGGTLGNDVFVGVTASPASTFVTTDGRFVGDAAVSWSYCTNSTRYAAGTPAAYGATWGVGDVIGVLLDLDAGSIKFTKNGVDQGTAATGLSGTLAPAVSMIDSTNFTARFSAGSWTYTPPVGYTEWGTPSNDVLATLPILTASAFGLVTGVYLQPLPMLSITAAGGVFGVYDKSLPMLTVSGSGLSEQFGNASNTLPMLMLEAVGSDAGNGVLASLLPLKSVTGNGFSGPAGAVAKSLPMLTLVAGTAPELRSTLPALSINGVGITGLAGSLAQLLPALQINAELLPYGFASGSPQLPMLGLSASALTESLGTLALTKRAMLLTATGHAGAVATASASMPALTGLVAGYGEYTLTAALQLPMLVTSSGVLVPTTASNFRTWVLNTRRRALTEYDWEFNSYATFRGTVLAASSAGLFKLDSSDADATAPIVGLVRTGKDHFGTSKNKRVPRIYVGVQCSAPLHFSTITTEGGKRTYMLAGNQVTGLQQRRVPIGRGPKSPYWQFEMSNPTGGDFLLDHFTVKPELTARRVV